METERNNKKGFLIFSNIQNQQYIYSGFSGLILMYDKMIADYLNEKSEENKELEKYLFQNHFGKNQDIQEDLSVGQITVFITNQCNMRCSYCYEAINEQDRVQNMEYSTLEKGVEFFLEKFNHDGNITITFFGGEPLLNFYLIKKAIALFEEIESRENVKFGFSLITNGTILNDEIEEFLITHNFNVMISMDGDQNLHDKHRLLYNGEGSFYAISQNVNRLSKAFNITARTTLTSSNVNLIQVYENLVNIGFHEVSIDLVAGENIDIDFTKIEKQMHIFSDYFIKNIKEKRIVRLSNLISAMWAIHHGVRKVPKSYPCAAGIKSYAIAVDGDIYPCHRFNNVSKLKWGNVTEGFNANERNTFLKEHLVCTRSSSHCADCWAMHLCGGTCYNSSLYSEGSTDKISKNQCLFNKSIFKSALYIYSSLDDNDKTFFDNIY